MCAREHICAHVCVLKYTCNVLSCVWFFAAPRIVAHQAPLPLKFFRQEYWKVKVAQLCLTLCDLMDYIVRGTLQARILEWVAFPFSQGSSQPWDRTQVSRIAGGFFTSWAIRENWSGVPFPTPGDHHDPDTELVSLVSSIGKWILYL